LHVKSPGTCHVKIESEAGDESALKLSQDGQSSAYVWMPGSTSDLRFYVNSADRMHIDNDGNIGIATTDPDYTLDVAGNIGLDEYIYHNGDADTYIRFQTNNINMVAGGKSAIKLDTSAGKIQLNNGNDDLDVEIMADDGEAILHTDAGTNMVGINTAAPKVGLDVMHNPTSLSNDTGGGEVVTFGAGPGGGSTTAGKLYYLDTDGQWEEADASGLTTSGVLLAIALGTTPGTHGMLLRGFFDVHSYFGGTFNEGIPVYVSTTAGEITATAPSGTGDIVRIVGFCTTTANVIYFNPSNNTLELS